MTQPLWKDIISNVDRMTSSKENQVVLNFGPSVMPLLTSLGLYKDKDLTSKDWPTTKHLWKTSNIGAFSSNIGILMFDCMQREKRIKKSIDSSRVMIFHQERPVRVPACGGLVCPLERFLDSFRHLALIDFNLTCAS